MKFKAFVEELQWLCEKYSPSFEDMMRAVTVVMNGRREKKKGGEKK